MLRASGPSNRLSMNKLEENSRSLKTQSKAFMKSWKTLNKRLIGLVVREFNHLSNWLSCQSHQDPRSMTAQSDRLRRRRQMSSSCYRLQNWRKLNQRLQTKRYIGCRWSWRLRGRSGDRSQIAIISSIQTIMSFRRLIRTLLAKSKSTWRRYHNCVKLLTMLIASLSNP